MKKSRTHVSDHAVIRYLERCIGVNIEGLRRRIGRRADVALDAGAEAVVIDGVRYLIRNGALITVTKTKRSRTKRRRVKRDA